MAFPLALETFIENLIMHLWAIFTALNDWLNVVYSFFFFAVSVSQPNKRDDNIWMHIEIGVRLWKCAWLSLEIVKIEIVYLGLVILTNQLRVSQTAYSLEYMYVQMDFLNYQYIKSILFQL